MFKWILKTILLLTGTLQLLKCDSGQKQKEADHVNTSLINLNNLFTKDTEYAYYRGISITGADVTTFEALDDNYAKDKNHVYYCSNFRDGQNYYMTKKNVITLVSDALPASFEVLTGGYGKDSHHAFFEGHKFKVKDIASLEYLHWYFLRDGIQAYYNCKPVAGSDGKSFKVMNDFYASDYAHIYMFGHPNESISGCIRIPCDRATFEILDYPYSKDQSNVFYAGTRMNSCDPNAFQILESGYSKDNDAVYFADQKVIGADARTFQCFKENEHSTEMTMFAKDKEAVFCNNKRILHADINSFKVLGMGYAIDDQYVFYTTKIVKGADPTRFKVYPHDIGDADSEDNNRKFHKGMTVISQ